MAIIRRKTKKVIKQVYEEIGMKGMSFDSHSGMQETYQLISEYNC